MIASLGTLQNKEILSFNSSEIVCSLRHTMISGWIPYPNNSLTLCCVGLVFTSWLAPIYGSKVVCI